MKKTETIAEFLARGGKITHIPTKTPAVKAENTKSSNIGGPAVFLTLGEADLFYGEQKLKKPPKKKKAALNINDLPEAIRKKFIDEVINGEEEDEDSED